MLVKLARSIQIDRNHLYVICMDSARGRSVADKSRPVVLLGMGCKRMCHALNGTCLAKSRVGGSRTSASLHAMPLSLRV